MTDETKLPDEPVPETRGGASKPPKEQSEE